MPRIFTEEQKERIRELNRLRYSKNSEACKKRSTEWAKKNHDRVCASRKRYTQKNSEKILAYQRNRRKTDERCAITNRMRVGFRAMIRGKQKKCNVTEFIGVCRDEFLKIMESKFKDGMTWENTQIDHYVPLSYFDVKNREDMFVAWNPLNLNPCFPYQNARKFTNLPEDHKEHIENIKNTIRTTRTT
jgi:hypothetical protein